MDISKKNGKSGMTLIEILIVVALLGVLAGVLIRSLSGTQEAGKQAAAKLFCETTLKTMLMAYKTSRGTWPRSKADLNASGISDATAWMNPWGQAAGYNFAVAADNVNIWTRFSNAEAGDAADNIDKNTGCVYQLEPSGKLTETTPEPPRA
ncbi:MAG: prepilin-type N-terminal cleavage/methylation domain-containing protein [Puniceicoccales bacterium]|jgi:prepilin-type N-terminal cleavage/methylation domain-containing protein|nr:prepilin-type N-terminal cleavage/methylation domain-containing protein [Puniceicoccales bacterium]